MGKSVFYKKIVVVALAIINTVFGTVNALAAGNNYGITYSTSGAQQLGSNNNVIQDADLVNDLTTLIKSNETRTQFQGSWQTGYISDTDQCKQIKYFRVSSNSPRTESDNFGFTFSNNNDLYRAEVKIKGASLFPQSSFTGDAIVGVIPNFGWIYGGWEIKNSTCTQPVSGITRIRNGNARLFVETEIKLYRKNATSPMVSNGLYLGLSDIDAAQSFKVLNSDSLLKPQNMYAKNLTDLQPLPSESTLHNYYVPQNGSNGNYIFSEYTSDKTISTPNRSNIFVKLGEQTQAEGLDMVFGFAGNAASGIEFYAKQYTVNYESDENGAITGIQTERVIGGENPIGSSETPNEHYISTNWTANKDITLKDDTVIAAGSPIQYDQITQVVVDKDITFTAHHAREYTVNYTSDNGGAITGKTTEQVVEASHPTGTTKQPNENYTFAHWIADVDVVLTDGTVIKVGEPISIEQLEQIIVNQDIEFTAVHIMNTIPTLNVPETGKMPQGPETVQVITASIFGLTAFGSIAMCSYIIYKKRNT